MATTDDLLEIHQRLVEVFGEHTWTLELDPLGELIGTLLSQHTNGLNSRRAFAHLRERYPTWDAVRDASVSEIAEVIRCAGLANQKAPRIKGVLQQIDDQRGTLALDFLAAMSIKGAMEWLRRLPGVGQTTAACVLLFGLGRPVMPVDSGILRIARRLGLVPPWGTPDDVQQALQASVPPTWIYTLHLNLTRFGRELCVASRPRCEVCPVNDRCAYFQVTHRAPLIAARGAESGWTR